MIHYSPSYLARKDLPEYEAKNWYILIFELKPD